MSLVKEKYNATKINMLHQLLCNDKEAGKPRDYDIKVDELKVVQRTSDPDQFLNHEDFVDQSTNSITITLYDGTSKRCTKYMYLLKGNPNDIEEELAGIDNKIQEKIDKEKNKWEFDRLKAENDSLKVQVKDGEEYVNKLEDEIDNLLAEKNSSKSKMTATLINLASMYIANKPNALNGFPFLGELLNAPADSRQIPNSAEPNETEKEKDKEEVNASFTRKETKTYTGEITFEDTQNLKTALTPFFKPEDIDDVVDIIQYLKVYPPFIEKVLEILEKAVSKSIKSE